MGEPEDRLINASFERWKQRMNMWIRLGCVPIAGLMVWKGEYYAPILLLVLAIEGHC